jgi:hypothetical protein
MTLIGLVWVGISVFVFALGALLPVWNELGKLPKNEETQDETKEI